MSGTLQITVVSAKLTHDTEVFSKMDPYCALKLKSQTLKTEIHKGGGKFPSWNQLFSIRTDELTDVIGFEVWDHDAISKDDLVGIGFQSVPYLLQHLDKQDEWVPLTYKEKKAGDLLISSIFFPDYVPPPPVQEVQNQYPIFQPFQPPVQPVQDNQGNLPPFNFYGQPIPPTKDTVEPIIQKPEEEKVVEPVIIQKPEQEIQPPIEHLPVFEETKSDVEKVLHDDSIAIFEKNEENLPRENMNEMYFKTNLQHPIEEIEKVVVICQSKDQGHCNEKESSSWVEVAIVDNKNQLETGRSTLFKNYQLNDFKTWERTIDDYYFLKALRKNHCQVALFARSIGGGWICSIKSCKIQVHFKRKHSECAKEEKQLREKVYDYERNEMLHGKENMNVKYIQTDLKENIVEVKEIEVVGLTKDQGWASVSGSSSWIELAVVNEEGHEITERKKIFENFKLKEFKRWETKINDQEILKALTKKGAQIAVYARSQYPGWICEVKEIKINIKCIIC